MHTLDDLRAGRLRGITRLNLNQGLGEFPREIFALADSLEVLDLSDNVLTELPDDLYRLTRLKVLFCANNRFDRLPHVIGRCQTLETVGFKSNRIEYVDAQALPPRLRSLVLTDNRVQQLPDALGDCLHLQKLMLAGNRLTQLPEGLARCERLELLRIASNHLSNLPDWLLRLPSLAWLAYADNPMTRGFGPPEVDGHCPSIRWQDVQLEEELGRGASGLIHRAYRQGHDSPVAVKLYKGAMTSDGSPLAEMRACIAAGDHHQLVGLIGRIDDHPQQLPALVMQLIDPTWRNLAGPPSLDSCTRDRHPEGRQLALPVVRRLASSIASVCAHLHARGLSHGDLYGHNILFAEDGQCLLGDFGAASFHPLDAGPQANALERLEVRAFGILVEELLTQCLEGDPSLHQLARRCQHPDVMTRPSFSALSALLAG